MMVKLKVFSDTLKKELRLMPKSVYESRPPDLDKLINCYIDKDRKLSSPMKFFGGNSAGGFSCLKFYMSEAS